LGTEVIDGLKEVHFLSALAVDIIGVLFVKKKIHGHGAGPHAMDSMKLLTLTHAESHVEDYQNVKKHAEASAGGRSGMLGSFGVQGSKHGNPDIAEAWIHLLRVFGALELAGNIAWKAGRWEDAAGFDPDAERSQPVMSNMLNRLMLQDGFFEILTNFQTVVTPDQKRVAFDEDHPKVLNEDWNPVRPHCPVMAYSTTQEMGDAPMEEQFIYAAVLVSVNDKLCERWEKISEIQSIPARVTASYGFTQEPLQAGLTPAVDNPKEPWRGHDQPPRLLLTDPINHKVPGLDSAVHGRIGTAVNGASYIDIRAGVFIESLPNKPPVRKGGVGSSMEFLATIVSKNKTTFEKKPGLASGVLQGLVPRLMEKAELIPEHDWYMGPIAAVGHYTRGTGGLDKPTKDLTLPVLQRKDSSQLLHLLRMSGVMVINADLENFLNPCMHLLHIMDLVGAGGGGNPRKMTLSKADFLLKVRQMCTGFHR